MDREPIRPMAAWRGWWVARFLEFLGMPISHLPVDLTEAGAQSPSPYHLSGGALVHNRGTAQHQPCSLGDLNPWGPGCPCTTPSQWHSCQRRAPLPHRQMVSTTSAPAHRAEEGTGRGTAGTAARRSPHCPTCLLAHEEITTLHHMHQHE